MKDVVWMRRGWLLGVALVTTACGGHSLSTAGRGPTTSLPSSHSPSRSLSQSSSSHSVSTSSSSPSSSSPTSPSFSLSSSPVPSTQTVTLPVAIITPSFGGGVVTFHYPAAVTVTAPVQWASQLQALGALGFVILTPKGWSGTAQEGADGSKRIVLYPPGGSAQFGPRILLNTSGGCVGCAWYQAAPYFSWVRQHFASAGWGTYQGPVISGYPLAADLRAYRAPNTQTGYHVNGIVYAPFIENPNGNDQVLFRQAETILPPGEHSLATVILNNLLPQLENPQI
ncbi:MAG: hypothetical protein C7B47_13770 [Sulfobacillus thermosulfidooxidans]|uniref:DUF4850 domain-containing protein n=1 Tax=Sulfobacillus thermosulfidooxidans TaxID=28034 RepID=A0A2T2WRJ9_SULTH|nr:MAG: hypothetical protein C7B47_13770 [Sulfobacillus thermosulfidooxidans]